MTDGPGHQRDAERLLVLGGTGMLGHVVWRAARERLDAVATVRGDGLDEVASQVLDPAATLTGVRAEDLSTVARALDEAEPGVVVNCIGVVKQADAVADPVTTVRVNALFPHELAGLCASRGARLVHVSTDCVFSGRKGAYTEDDPPDPTDRYGRSKLLGEPSGPHVLTLRTSMIGWELGRVQGLLEWFASQGGQTVRGFTRAVFSGPSAPVLARAVVDVAERSPDLTGTMHVAARPIAKHELLLLLRDALALDVDVVPDDELVIDRSLDPARFGAATGFAAPEWEDMVQELAAERAAAGGVDARG